MENTFADYETSLIVRELKFDMNKCLNWKHGKNFGISLPLWSQIEEWLWEKHKISIEIERVSIHAVLYKVRVYQYVDNEPGLIQYLHFESPITCKIEGIKTAVKHLSETAVAVTPKGID